MVALLEEAVVEVATIWVLKVEPMSAYDRKIIHSYLSSKNDIVTESVGEGMNRHIIIKYVENKPL
jgi:predicted RNA-binding protein Jag